MKFLTYLILVCSLLVSIAFITPDYGTNRTVLVDTLVSQTAGIGEIIEASDTFTTSVTFRNLTGPSGQYLLYIYLDSTNSGTIKFSLNESMEWVNDSTAPLYDFFEWSAGSQLRMTVSDYRNLYYKASASGQKFVVMN